MYRKWLISDKNQEEEPGKAKFVIIMPHYYSCPDGSHVEEAAAFVAQEERNAQQEIQSSQINSSDLIGEINFCQIKLELMHLMDSCW